MGISEQSGTPGKGPKVALPVYGSDDCQVMTLPAAGTEYVVAPRMTLRYVLTAPFRAVANPARVVRKLMSIVRTRDRNAAKTAQDGAEAVTIPPLALQSGEVVRVKSSADIRATLDGDGRYERLAYMANVMDPYCGRTFRVRGRVDRFFDERSWRMMRLKNVVLLEGVYCQPLPDDDVSWAGCQRSCFLFWKEGWLERVGAAQLTTDEVE